LFNKEFSFYILFFGKAPFSFYFSSPMSNFLISKSCGRRLSALNCAPPSEPDPFRIHSCVWFFLFLCPDVFRFPHQNHLHAPIAVPFFGWGISPVLPFVSFLSVYQAPYMICAYTGDGWRQALSSATSMSLRKWSLDPPSKKPDDLASDVRYILTPFVDRGVFC